ncbi:hypothetical protein IAQ61_009195 [Plenodomus lingam]|uniref:uncharacterized protein n=1 Tax=Leptosphaeria maculans TaxID=5022 RepID=UPI00331738C4|nr:hypothetical protein IAQ61_009195 [Plenodomus lingam]
MVFQTVSTYGASISLLISLSGTAFAVPAATAHGIGQFPPASSTPSSIDWKPCPPDWRRFLRCANFSVPVDWEKPHGEHFNLGLVKMSAWKTDLTEPNRTLTRIGSLFLNYGGPGASGIAAIRDFADRGSNVPQSIFESFDLIGLDPRGVGLSNGISCNNKIHAENVAYAPQNEEEFNKMVDKNRRYAESCRELTGPLFEHLDTIR